MEHVDTALLARLNARLDAQERELITLRATLAGIGGAPSPVARTAPTDVSEAVRPAPKRPATRRGVLKGAGALVFTTALLATGEVVPVAPYRVAAADPSPPARPSGASGPAIASNADTVYQSFEGTDFQPLVTSRGMVAHFAGYAFGAGVITMATAGPNNFDARLNLPQGATVTEVIFYVFHNDANAMAVDIAEIAPNNGGVGSVTSAGVTTVSASVQAITLTPNIVVDNTQHTYAIEWLANTAGAAHALYGARVGYTLPGSAQVYGSAQSGIGVNGQSVGGYGVEGYSVSAGGIGVLGASSAGTGVKGAAVTGFPIIGQAVAATNTAAGVLGAGTAGPGVQGQSTSGHGLVGTTDDGAGHAGLIGNATATGGIGLMGIAPNYGTMTVGHAGEFYGNVKIYGGSLLAPSVQAAVTHTDGSSRALYTEGATESWLADYGVTNLTNSVAHITLDPDFAALIETTGYQVYLTEYDDHNNLFVTQRSASGFMVQAKESASGSGVKAPTKGVNTTFGYRVVGKRKDITGARLAKVAAPGTPPRPTAFTIPETPNAKPPTTKP